MSAAVRVFVRVAETAVHTQSVFMTGMAFACTVHDVLKFE